MGGLREKLKNQNYGNPPRPLLPSEKAIFDRLPNDADEETLKTTERLLRIFIRVSWLEEELSQDSDDFLFVKNFCESYQSNDKQKKVFFCFDIKGIGNLIKDLVLDLTLLKNEVKVLEERGKKLDSELEETRKLYWDSREELRKIKEIFSLLKKNGGVTANASIQKRLKRAALIRKIGDDNFMMEADYFEGKRRLEDKKRWEIREEKFEKQIKLVKKRYKKNERGVKIWSEVDEEKTERKSKKGQVLECVRHRLFRHEFLAVLPYRFAELFWEADEDLEESFFQTLETDNFFSELRTKTLPEEYFKKGWKPAKKLPSDRTELAEVKRIFKLILSVTKWKWVRFIFENIDRKDLDVFSGDEKIIRTILYLPPPKYKELLEEEKFFNDKDNFVFVESGELAEGQVLKKIVTRDDKKEWPHRVLELREIFFFFEKVFPRSSKEKNPLLSENGFIERLLKSYEKRTKKNFTIWKQDCFFDSINEFGHPNKEFGLDLTYFAQHYYKFYTDHDFYDYVNELVKVSKSIEEPNNFFDLFYYFFFDKKLTSWGEFEFKSGLHKKSKAGSYLQSVLIFKNSYSDIYNEASRASARNLSKAIRDLRTIVEKNVVEEGYVDSHEDLKFAIAFAVHKSASQDREDEKVRVELEKREDFHQLKEISEKFAEKYEKVFSSHTHYSYKSSFSFTFYMGSEIIRMNNCWEPVENLIESREKTSLLHESKLNEVKKKKKNKKKKKKRDWKKKFLKTKEKIQEKEKNMIRISVILSQQPSQVDDTKKIESFSQFIFRFDSLGYQIFWTIFFLVITNALALIYFCWDKIMAWWNKSSFDWVKEEE